MARMLFLCIVHASILKCLSMAISTSGLVAPGTSMQQSITHAETSTIQRNKKKKTTTMDVSLVKYLRKFKYLDPSPCPSCDQDSSIISEALSTLQQWAHINNTGILDSDTVEVMSKRRCGVPDEPKQFSVSSVKNKRHKRSFFWQIYHGSRWYKNDLTYIINMPHKFPNKRAVEKIISAALHAWESVTLLTFTQKRYGYADIEVNFLTGRHGDGSPFDGNGGILAHAFFPYDNSPGLSGDAHFDADEDWGSEMDLNTTADLYCVAVHEFGHSLGLMHSRWPISIMWPWMKGDCTLSKFDIAVIQKIYGPASEQKWKRRRPTAHPPQTTRPFLKPNWPRITTTIITSTPSPPTVSVSTAPIETVTMSSTSTVPIPTSNNINTIANTVQLTKENTDTIMTTDYKSPSDGSVSMTVTQTDRSLSRSNAFPITTGIVNSFQPSVTMAKFVSTPKENFQTQETATPKSLPVQNSQASLSTVSFINNLPSKNSLSSLLFQTSSIPGNISYEQKLSQVPILEKNDFLPQIRPSDPQKSYSTENGLLLKSSPSEPNTSLSENTQSSLNVLRFINTFSTPNSLSSLSQLSWQNDLSSEPPDILASVNTLYTQKDLSQNLSSQNLSPQPNDSLLKSSQSEPTRPPHINNFSLKKHLTPDPRSLPSASPFYTYKNRLKRPHFLNEINQMNMLSHLPQILTSSMNPRLPLLTSEDPFSLVNTSLYDYQYLQMFDSGERTNVKEKVSRPVFVANTEQLIEAVTSVTSQPKSSAANFQGTSQLSDIQHSLKIKDQHSPDELVFNMHLFPERNPSFPSTQLYKTATISMTTKPVVSSNELKWMLTPASQVTIDSEPTIPIQTSPEITVSLHLQQIIYNESAFPTNSYFDPLPSTQILLFDKKANNHESQEKKILIEKEQENGEVFRLKHKLDKTDQNDGKTIQRKKELYEGFYQEKTLSKLTNILKERSKGKSQQILPIFHKNSYKLRPATFKYNKIYKKLQPTQTLTLDKKKRSFSNLRFPLISSEAVPGFGKALRQQNQEREVFLPSSLQKSVGRTFLKSPTHLTSSVPFVDLNASSLSSSTTLFAGGADARKNRPFQVVGGKKRVKMFKPRFRQKMRMQQFIQNLLYSTMRMIPRQGPPKLNLLTTPSLQQNVEVSIRTLSAPPTNHVLSHVVTPSFKAETYLIPEALSHKFLNAQTSPTTQKWTGDTQRNLPQIMNFQVQDSAKNYLHEPLHVLSIDQQTTPLLLMMQNPLEQEQSISKGQRHNDRNSNIQLSSLLPFRLKAAISDQENVQTTSETIFRKVVTPHQQQQMVPMSIYAKKLKESQEGTVPSSWIHKRSLAETNLNDKMTPSENWMFKYSPTLATSPSFVSQSTLYSHQVDIATIPTGDNSIRNVSERYSHYSEKDGIKTLTMTTTNPRTFMPMKPWCYGSVQIDGATVDGNGTINIFNDSNVMRFPFSARNIGKKRRTFIPISRVFPNGPSNVTAAVTIILGKKKKWERTYLFQGHLVWRYRKCLRRYCLDRGYPTNISQEFNVSTPIEITSAYMHNRRRTLFLFNGTSLYHTVRCLRWLRKSGCSSMETEMQPGLLSSLRSIDAMFTHQGNFYVIHGGSYFTKMLRSTKNNIFQHGSIAESWYGCQRKTF